MAVSGHSFWTWSVGVYGRPGVEQMLLDLQDRLGLDINILLFACWTAMYRRRPLSVGECGHLVAATREWRDNVIVPLRAVRRFMKTEQGMAGAEDLRENVKRLELEAEQIMQQRLAGMVELDRDGGDAMADPAEIVMAGFEAYLLAENIGATARDRDLLSSLARACCE